MYKRQDLPRADQLYSGNLGYSAARIPQKDSVTGEEITSVELSEITVMARSKQVAERNGKINLDFVVTVPGELISNKWQLQLAPVAYKPSDTLYLDRIFLSGA